MKLKRIIAVALAALMIVALVGCGSKKRQVVELTLSTEDSEAILRAAGITLPDADSAPGAGSTVKWCAHYDPFQNYSEDEIVNTGFYTFKEKYGGSLEWVQVEWAERWNDRCSASRAYFSFLPRRARSVYSLHSRFVNFL